MQHPIIETPSKAKKTSQKGSISTRNRDELLLRMKKEVEMAEKDSPSKYRPTIDEKSRKMVMQKQIQSQRDESTGNVFERLHKIAQDRKSEQTNLNKSAQ